MLHKQLIMPQAQPKKESFVRVRGELASQLSQIVPMAQTAFHQDIDETVQLYYNRSQVALHCSEDPVPNFAKPTTAAMAQRAKKNSVRVMGSPSLEYGGQSTLSQSTSHRCLPCRRQSVAEAKHRYSVMDDAVSGAATERPRRNLLVATKLTAVIDQCCQEDKKRITGDVELINTQQKE